jgi:hypothetical protein
LRFYPAALKVISDLNYRFCFKNRESAACILYFKQLDKLEFILMEVQMRKGLTGNQLKLIAVITMTVDHIGMVLFPQQILFRMIGRLAFPIYAFMIAEGCVYTRSFPRYLGMLTGVAVLCQGVYFVVLRSLYQCILVTFSMSVMLILLLRRAMEKKTVTAWGAAACGIALVFFITEVLPGLLPDTDFSVDYGFLGVMLPPVIYLGKNKVQKLCFGAAVLLAMGAGFGDIQMWALLALPLLALYNGQRGKWRMKYFFYIYYPAHLVIIYGAGILLRL